MAWSREFDEPIILANGKTLRTLGDARQYVLKLPRKVQEEERWQTAAGMLLNAATREQAWMFFARIAMLQAINRSPPIQQLPERRVGKPVHWRRRASR